jgi:hypothetical protein
MKTPHVLVPISQAMQYAAAEVSRVVLGPLPPDEVESRLAACRSCEHLQVVDGKGEFCGQCGCGHRRRAELSIKATMPRASCPLGKWGTAKKETKQ